MQKIIAFALAAILFSCSKPGDTDPGNNPGPGDPASPIAITEVNPATGDPNTLMVIITGRGFNATAANNEVLLNNLGATVKTAAITQLVIELPTGITEGLYDVTVKANGRSATKKDGFRYVTGELEIVTVTPENLLPNTPSITITGRGFAGLPANNEVRIGTFAATVNTAMPGQLVVGVPANITPGVYDVKVTANGKTTTKVNAVRYDNTAVTSFAGSGTSGTADGTGDQAQFALPVGLAKDGNNNLYVADMHRIRKITPGGQVTTYAGSGLRGADNGASNIARFNTPSSIAVDQAGNLYVADQFNHQIRKISTNGNVTTIAGNTSFGHTNGIGTNASFSLPYGVAVNPQGTILYVGDYGNNRIRRIDLITNEVSDYAGDGTGTSKDGNGTQAGIPSPGGLFLAQDGTLYLTEKGAGKIRKISPSGNVTTIGGSLSADTSPTQLVTDTDGNVYVVFRNNNHIKKYTSAGAESVIFGSGLSGDANGPASEAKFFIPEGIALVENANGSKTFYIADSGNKKIRKVVLN